MQKTLWFKRKKYGWGWIPASWHGWVVTLFFLVIIVLIGLSFDASTTVADGVSRLLVPVLLLIAICYMTGERPQWQWGERTKDVE